MIYKLNKKKYKIPYLHLFNFFYKKFKILGKKKKKLKIKKIKKISKTFIRGFFYKHQGQFLKKLKINKYYVGYKFGEFSYKKKPFLFKPKKKKRDARR